jgi:transposase-like protein
MGTRRQFSREFKLEAVRLVKERGVSVPQAARDLEVHENVLRKWVREAAADPQEAFVGLNSNPIASRIVVLPTSPPPRSTLTPPAGFQVSLLMPRKRSTVSW